MGASFPMHVLPTLPPAHAGNVAVTDKGVGRRAGGDQQVCVLVHLLRTLRYVCALHYRDAVFGVVV